MAAYLLIKRYSRIHRAFIPDFASNNEQAKGV
jgi:hypothetical protein